MEGIDSLSLTLDLHEAGRFFGILHGYSSSSQTQMPVTATEVKKGFSAAC